MLCCAVGACCWGVAHLDDGAAARLEQLADCAEVGVHVLGAHRLNHLARHYGIVPGPTVYTK